MQSLKYAYVPSYPDVVSDRRAKAVTNFKGRFSQILYLGLFNSV